MSKSLLYTDEELLEGCRAVKRAYQRALYDQYAPKLLFICLRYVKAQQEAEDVLQEAFIKVFHNIKGFRGDSSLFHWMKRIVINTALNSQRGKLYMYPMHDLSDTTVRDYEPELGQYHLKDLLIMISELPTGCRVVFNLHAIEGYKHEEIGKMLGISPGTSKSQLARARMLLQEKLIKEEKLSHGGQV